jgi:hypothetical protein
MTSQGEFMEKPFKLSLFYRLFITLFYSKEEKEKVWKRIELINSDIDSNRENFKRTTLKQIYDSIYASKIESGGASGGCGMICSSGCVSSNLSS